MDDLNEQHSKRLTDRIEDELLSTQLSHFVDRLLSNTENILMFVYENERKNLFYGWGNTIGIHIYPPVFDRHPFTDDSGKHIVSGNGLSNIKPLTGEV